LNESNETKQEFNAAVLLVEDDRPLLEFFSTVLKRDGYQVFQAGNGVEALEFINSHPDQRIDILLSDVTMPYMGGIQLSEHLKEAWPDVRVLLTSALPQQEVKDRCGPTFTPDFLAKPFSVSDLSGKLKLLSESV